MTPEMEKALLNEDRVPFGEMPREMQLAMFEAWLGGGMVQCWAGIQWGDIRPVWSREGVYRVILPKRTADQFDFSHLHGDFICIARDEDGSVWGYKCRPHVLSTTWETGEGWGCRIDGRFVSYKRGTCDWKDSLLFRPGYEDKQ